MTLDRDAKLLVYGGLWFVAAIVLVLISTSCGGDGDDEPAPPDDAVHLTTCYGRWGDVTEENCRPFCEVYPRPDGTCQLPGAVVCTEVIACSSCTSDDGGRTCMVGGARCGDDPGCD